jgi:azurin
MKNVFGVFGVAVVGAVLALGLTTSAKPAAAARVIKMTANDAMKFDQPTLTVKPGESLELQLTNIGTLPKEAMAHNFVLLAKAADNNAFVMEAAMAKATAYIPAKYKKDVLAATALAGPGETVKVTFLAPKVEGSYTYLCSFAGHFFAGMKGTLIVKK